MPPPALHASALEKRAVVPISAINRDGDLACTEIDRRQGIAHLAGDVAAIVGVCQTALAVVILPPAPDASVIQKCTAMRSTRRDGHGSFTDTKIDCGKVVAHLTGLVAAIVGIAQAEFACPIIPPAFHCAIVQ